MPDSVTELRVNVRDVTPSTELTFDEAEQWVEAMAAAAGVSRDAWLKKAGVKTEWKQIKARRKEGGAPRDWAQLRKALEDAQQKHRTEVGERLLSRLRGLEEWSEIGDMLSRDPDVFRAELRRLRPIAEVIQQAYEDQQRADASRAKLDEIKSELSTSMGVPEPLPFESPTPRPKGSRK